MKAKTQNISDLPTFQCLHSDVWKDKFGFKEHGNTRTWVKCRVCDKKNYTEEEKQALEKSV